MAITPVIQRDGSQVVTRNLERVVLRDLGGDVSVIPVSANLVLSTTAPLAVRTTIYNALPAAANLVLSSDRPTRTLSIIHIRTPLSGNLHLTTVAPTAFVGSDLRIRLLLYNGNPYDRNVNPFGLGHNGHRTLYVQVLKDIAAAPLIASSAARTRLAEFYSEDDYDFVTEPGGMGDNGHRINFVPSLHDVSTVTVALLGSSTPETDRLASFYTSTSYNALSNPGGLARRGHLLNFEDALTDVAAAAHLVGQHGF